MTAGSSHFYTSFMEGNQNPDIQTRHPRREMVFLTGFSSLFPSAAVMLLPSADQIGKKGWCHNNSASVSLLLLCFTKAEEPIRVLTQPVNKCIVLPLWSDGSIEVPQKIIWVFWEDIRGQASEHSPTSWLTLDTETEDCSFCRCTKYMQRSL